VIVPRVENTLAPFATAAATVRLTTQLAASTTEHRQRGNSAKTNRSRAARLSLNKGSSSLSLRVTASAERIESTLID
jgi:hypothetical protein